MSNEGTEMNREKVARELLKISKDLMAAPRMEVEK